MKWHQASLKNMSLTVLTKDIHSESSLETYRVAKKIRCKWCHRSGFLPDLFLLRFRDCGSFGFYFWRTNHHPGPPSPTFMWPPWVQVVPNFFSEAECVHLRQLVEAFVLGFVSLVSLGHCHPLPFIAWGFSYRFSSFLLQASWMPSLVGDNNCTQQARSAGGRGKAESYKD